MSDLDALDALVGEWTMEATPPGGPPWPGDARVTFEWLDHAFLIERWTIEMPEAPNGIAVIGHDPSGQGFVQHYFDSRGVARVYGMSLEDGEWKLWRHGEDFSQRFSGTFSEDGKRIEGRWDIALDGETWETDFDLHYTKVE
jgi:Protein of unknown function (DUF1579)